MNLFKSTGKKTLVIHIGYPKTGTTTLQTWVLPNVGGYTYLGKTYPPNLRSIDEQDLCFALYCPTSESAPEEHLRGAYQRSAARILTLDANSAVLISFEECLAQCLVPARIKGAPLPLSGGWQPAPSLAEALDHLKRFTVDAGFEEVKVIVTLRPQHEILSSHFAERYQDVYGRIRPMRDYESFVDHIFSDPHPLIDPRCLDFAALHAALTERFGRDNVLMQSLGVLAHQPEAFAVHMGAFLDVPASTIAEQLRLARSENVRRKSDGSLAIKRKDASYAVARVKNFLLPNHNLGIGKHLGAVFSKLKYGPQSFRPSDTSIHTVENHYRQSNEDFFVRPGNEFLRVGA